MRAGGGCFPSINAPRSSFGNPHRFVQQAGLTTSPTRGEDFSVAASFPHPIDGFKNQIPNIAASFFLAGPTYSKLAVILFAALLLLKSLRFMRLTRLGERVIFHNGDLAR